jgi:tetratricopeptide (TPR) repeat protein
MTEKGPVHRFTSFEIDEATRELRVRGQLVTVQPRIFDVLVYLARHRHRVVGKDELLDAVWPGVIVADGSLQRAISLARGALEEAGAGRVIRTYPRRGYRLVAEEPGPGFASPTVVDLNDPLVTAHAAYETGDWESALAGLHQVDAADGLGADDLQRCAHAAQCAGRPQEAIPLLERAVSTYSIKGDRRSAAWAALLLAHLRTEWREPILAKGWLHRAERLLQGEPVCREWGYLRLMQARLIFAGGDASKALELAREAQRIGAQFEERDLESLGLTFVGESEIVLGNIAEGLAAIDEAGATVVANNLSSWAGGLVYCAVIYNCMLRADWHRAAEWSGQFTRWCEVKGAEAYPGLCRMHRAEVFAVRGHLDEAEQEIRGTLEILRKNAPWAEADALSVLGEISLARGDFDAAREAFTRAQELGWDAHFHFALLRFAEGDAAAAERLLAHAIASEMWSCRVQRGRALLQYIIVAALAGHREKAHRALQALEARPELVSTSAMQALLARARAEVAVLHGETGDAIGLLRTSVHEFHVMNAPLAAAQSRCRLAAVLAAAGDRESAAMELVAAVSAFEHAGAHGLLQHCHQLQSALQQPRAKAQQELRDQK